MANTFLEHTLGTPDTNGNKKGTFSAWIKRTNLATEQAFYVARSSDTNMARFRFLDTNYINVIAKKLGQIQLSIDQIKQLQTQQETDNTALQSGYFLKSQNWYSQKLIEELNQSETKQKFIEKELTELKRSIAIEHQNMKRAETKADEKRKKDNFGNSKKFRN